MSFCVIMASCSVVPLLGVILFLCLLDHRLECCFYNMIHHAAPIAEGEPPKSFGDPLYLTPILKTYYKKMAKRFSMVENLPNTTSDVQGLESYSGFLTVNETHGSHLFFWFFPAIHNKESVPLIIWLQGGPGFSSMIGVFAENGPLKVHYTRGKVTLRETTWIKTMNVLYIDSPVGSGFSHTRDDKNYARDESQITAHLINAIEQFFTIFEDYRTRNIYIAGEGYSCKSVFNLAYELHSTEGGKHKLDLEGIILGNGICDWKMFTNHSFLLQNTGLINEFQAKLMLEKSSKIQKLFQTRNFVKAYDELAGMFKDQPSETSLFRNMTGYESLYDFAKTKIPEDLYMYTTYLAQKEARRSLHVGLTPFGSHDKVCQHLTTTFGIPIQPRKLLTLLSKYKTLFYHGRRDLLVPYGSFLHFLNEIRFDETDVNTFEQPFSERFNWFRNDKEKGRVFAGHVYQLDDIITVILWNAGHFAAYDDPKTVYDMVENFVFEKSFKD